MTSAAFDLDQKFRAGSATVHVTGVQAVIRGLLDQLREDRARGLRTAGFVSGYQGSPLAGFDRELASAMRKVDDVEVVMRPAVNEELGATAVMGSQLASLHDGPYDGVVGLWYGKAPGLDRALDAIRHGNYVGSARWGGAVALVGDDPQAKSSTVPSASEAILADLSIPVLVPADLSDARTMVPYAVALSRASGGWVGVKLTTSVADGSGTLTTDPVPVWEWPAAAGSIPVNGHLLTPVTLEREPLVVRARGEIVRAFADANPIDRVDESSAPSVVTVVAAGPTALVVREALGLLGLGPAECRAAGVRVVRLGLISPLAPSTLARIMDRVGEVVVVEERRNLVERQLLETFRGRGATVVGWRDHDGAPLVPPDATLTAAVVADVLYARLRPLLGERVGPPARRRIPLVAVAPPTPASAPAAVARSPWYCPGCPHSVSTRVPEGTHVGAGIGCACMVVNMPPERVGTSVGLVQMGGEGAQWIGMSPFVDLPRITQNVGDGTFFHSGQLALRAAVAAEVDITYKILYNGFVAMTGGQLATGQQKVGTLVRSLLGEGVTAVAITTDTPKGYRRRHGIPREVEVHDRRDVLAAQERLAMLPGVTVLVHDQPCATEMRRARTRGRAPMPTERVMINQRVCEGCGDCAVQSACLALVPVATSFGTKTMVDERACTVDRSCLQGDCPAFALVPVTAPKPARDDAAVPGSPASAALPAPVSVPSSAAVRFAGIGGNGVVTIAHLLGTAALLDGLSVRGLDQTGLAQKGGGVVSDVIITRVAHEAPNAAPADGVDVLIAADVVVAQTPGVLATLDPDRSVVVGSLDLSLTGDMLVHPGRDRPDGASLAAALDSVTRAQANTWVDVAAVRARLDLSAASGNLVLLGVAFQRGLLPVSEQSVVRAIHLNGVSVAANLAAFDAGRALVATPGSGTDPAFVSHADHGARWSGRDTKAENGSAGGSAASIVELEAELVRHQGARSARRFRSLCADVATAVAGAERADEAVAAVAFGFHKLLAYKDEYEVARLLLQHPVADGKVVWMLHPPMLRAIGVRRKIRMGPWSRPLMHALVAMRRLRGTPLDPFGRAEVRRVERALPGEFEVAVRSLLATAPLDVDAVVRVGRLPDLVRGYEQVKLRSAAEFRAALAR